MNQKYHRGDVVRVLPHQRGVQGGVVQGQLLEWTPMMSPHAGREAVVVGSYRDLYGDTCRDQIYVLLFRDGGGRCAWFNEEVLEFLAPATPATEWELTENEMEQKANEDPAFDAERTLWLSYSFYDEPGHPSKVVEQLRNAVLAEFPGAQIKTVAQSLGDCWWIFVEFPTAEDRNAFAARPLPDPLRFSREPPTQKDLDHWTTFKGRHLS